jgi:hypothetical protein
MLDFSGQSCDGLVTREFWLRGQPLSRACYVFLALSGGEAIGWYFDDDVEVWQAEPIGVMALPGTAEGDQEFHYPHIDLASRYELRGRRLCRWFARESGATAEAHLVFTDGSSVIFSHECSADRDSVRFEPGDIGSSRV